MVFRAVLLDGGSRRGRNCWHVVVASRPGGYTGVMHLRHLGLPVRDRQRSIRFYAQYFEFNPETAESYPDGTVIVRNSDHFDLALHQPTDAAATSDFLHFGFAMRNPAAVRALQGRLMQDGVSVI